MGKAFIEQGAPTTQSLHGRLKDIVSEEITRLPELLEKLEPKERVKTLLALLPYTTPKIETVASDYGEPCTMGWEWLENTPNPQIP